MLKLYQYDISSKNFMESLLSTTDSDYDIKNTMEKYLTDMKKHFCINNELLELVFPIDTTRQEKERT